MRRACRVHLWPSRLFVRDVLLQTSTTWRSFILLLFCSFLIPSVLVSNAFAQNTPLVPANSLLAGIRPAQLTRASFSVLPGMNGGESTNPIDPELLSHRQRLIQALNFNLLYLDTSEAEASYHRFHGVGISRALMKKTLRRFRDILVSDDSVEEVNRKVQEEFALYRVPGGEGSVKFTGYFQPTYKASFAPTAEYRFPIFHLPPDFKDWGKPHPKRSFLEGYEGTGNPQSPLFGFELAWLRSRWEAFMIHVQGSAILEMADGTKLSVGFAAGTEHPFRGVSASFLKANNVAWSKLGDFFEKHPGKLNEVLSKNNRFIFFKPNPGWHPVGNLGVPIVPLRSIATDKAKLPPGALGLIRTRIPFLSDGGAVTLRTASRFVLDQDTGSAIKGPTRVDIFMGTGPQAQKMANHVFSNGDLFYLVLKDSELTYS